LGGFDERLGLAERPRRARTWISTCGWSPHDGRLDYTPNALVWARTSGHPAGLRKQLARYGTGLAATFLLHAATPTRSACSRAAVGGDQPQVEIQVLARLGRSARAEPLIEAAQPPEGLRPPQHVVARAEDSGRERIERVRRRLVGPNRRLRQPLPKPPNASNHCCALVSRLIGSTRPVTQSAPPASISATASASHRSSTTASSSVKANILPLAAFAPALRPGSLRAPPHAGTGRGDLSRPAGPGPRWPARRGCRRGRSPGRVARGENASHAPLGVVDPAGGRDDHAHRRPLRGLRRASPVRAGFPGAATGISLVNLDILPFM